jgi:Ca-activated chloride channel family protein
MNAHRTLPAALAAIAVVTTVLAGQSADPSLRIVSPDDEAYLSGAVRLVAAIDPAAAVAHVVSVTFFADGRQICVIAKPPFECDWDAGERITEHQIRAAALLRDGRRIVATVRTRGLRHVEAVDVDVVQITAVVTDSDGRFVRGLAQQDFKVFDNGKPQPITSFAAENIPLELVTAIDVSASMEAALPRVKAAAKGFLAALDPNDQVTVLGFNENVFTLARRSTDRAARARAVDRMASWGGTAVYDVIIKAIEMLGRQAGRRSIVLFSDGDDQSSHAPLAEAVAAAEGSDATIYAIGMGRARRAAQLQKLLRRLATVSGGRAFFPDDSAKLEGTFAEILEDLRHQYLISYPAPDAQRDGAWHQIRVEVSGGRQVRARQGYRLMRHD